MIKNIFQIFAIVGMIAISILAFTIPTDPYEIIPAISVMGFDKPLWLAIIISCGVIYLLTLWYIYDEVSKRKNSITENYTISSCRHHQKAV